MKNIFIILIALSFLIIGVGFVSALDMELKNINDNAADGNINITEAFLAGYGICSDGSNSSSYGVCGFGSDGNDSHLYCIYNLESLLFASPLGGGGNQNFY